MSDLLFVHLYEVHCEQLPLSYRMKDAVLATLPLPKLDTYLIDKYSANMYLRFPTLAGVRYLLAYLFTYYFPC